MRGSRLIAGAALLFVCLSAPNAAPERSRISASNLRPGPGELVWLELRYDGPWPAALSWEGVDRAEGPAAELLARTPGTLRVSVEQDGRVDSLEIEVQPAENRGWVQSPTPLLRSLPALFGACTDPRYPKLAGVWAVGCGPSGQVDRAVNLRTNQVVELHDAARSPAMASGVVYAPGVEHGLWRLPDPEPASGVHHMPEPGVFAAGTDGARVAVSTREDIQVFGLFDAGRQRYAAHPAPWYAPAVSALGVAWVDLGEAGLTGEDIWFLADGARNPEPLVRKVGAQRHVAASGPFLGWIDDDGVRVEDLRSGERRFYGSDAHTSTSLSLWGPVACWEVYGAEDVDLSCSDGMVLVRPGHQRSPSRYGPWLLFREGSQVLLATEPYLTLDDDDPRAVPLGLRVADPVALRGARIEGGVVYELELPEGAWKLERHEATGWVEAPALIEGALSIEAPFGDAIRLTPADGGP